MSTEVHEQAHELRPVHHQSTADSGHVQLDGPANPGQQPCTPEAPAAVETEELFLGEASTFHVDLYDGGLGSASGVGQELLASSATQIAPASAPSGTEDAAPLPAQQPRSTHQLRRRRARVRWRLWLTSKLYVIKIALASKRGKMITTCTFTFIQITAIIALLIVSSRVQSPAAPGYSQWDACPRRLQAFDIIQVGKAVIGWPVNVWWILRQPNESIPLSTMGRVAYRLRQDFIPYFTAILHIVLSAVLFSTLTGSPTAWDLSPTIFFACIVALFRTWLAVAEVVLLVVGGAIYAICYASLAIFCPGILPRRAVRLGGINPTIGPLSTTQLEQIPIVQYASMSTVSLVLPPPPSSTLGRLRLKRNDTSLSASRQAVGPKRHKIEKHRAACAICLNDFVDMKRVHNAPPVEQPRSAASHNTQFGTAPSSPLSLVSPAATRRSAEGTGVDVEQGNEATIPVVFLAPAGTSPLGEELPRPTPTEPEELRLLPCEHVFHKECIDPWLRDVSGRCPTCQRPVFGGEEDEAV